MTLPEEVALQPSVEVSEATPSSNPSAPSPSYVQTPSSDNQGVPFSKLFKKKMVVPLQILVPLSL